MNLSASQTNQSDSRTLGVLPINPVAFLDTVTPPVSVDFQHCPLSGAVYGGGPLPLAFNRDGSRNTCSNPASAASPVLIFLAGLGLTSPAPVTGSINPNATLPLNLPVAFSQGIAGTVIGAIALPGALDATWQVDLTVPPRNSGAVPISLSVNSVPVRDAGLTIWTH